MNDKFSHNNPVLLVGCGHMGSALALGWLKAGLDPDALNIVDPALGAGSLPGMLAEVPAANLATSIDALRVNFCPRAIVLATKPQLVADILPSIAGLANKDALVISIAAGITLAQLQEGLSTESALVRAMPNMPAAIGAGITGMAASADTSREQKQLAGALLSAIGETVWISSETLMDVVTAVSGSGPAYVFRLVESMAAAGVEQGLSEDVAMRLARQTVIGSAQLMASETEVQAAELRERVTSPGGTTAAALDILMQSDDGMDALMKKAIAAARKRGSELAS